MRIALIGQAVFAEKALDALLKHGDEIVHVFSPPDPPAGRPDALTAKARELKLPLSQPISFKTDAAFEQFKALDADLGVLAFVTLIVPERVLYAPRHQSICFHPSLLPTRKPGSPGSGPTRASIPARYFSRRKFRSNPTTPSDRFTSTGCSRSASIR